MKEPLLLWKKAEWASSNIGKEFDGQIVSLIDFGMFIKIPNGVEGLIHITDFIDDEYIYDDVLFAIIGNKNKRMFKPGQEFKVFIKNANKDSGKIDFGMVEFKKEILAKLEAWNSKKNNKY